MPARYRFGGCELDAGKRHLLVGGAEVALQPRVFDLLLFLVEQRHRVVGKEELVAAVWQGAFIADGAVQRAVSLARAALRPAGLEDAIRTYSRQGYRFCAEAEPADREGPPATRPPPGCDPAAWQAELERLRRADAGRGLRAADLERWGQLTEYLGRSDESLVPLERAVAAYAAAGEARGAGRCAIRLANILLERREMAVGGGWLQRATRYLAGAEETHETGLLAWMECRYRLFAGDLEGCLRGAERCFEIGRRLEDLDLEALGLVYRGFALLALGDLPGGSTLLDEAGATILAGGVDPWIAGLVFCGIILGCMNAGDLRRAAEWTEQFTRWCAAGSVAGYPGVCRLHRAEVLVLRGELAAAEQEAAAACDLIARSLPWAEGDAHRVLGEIRLAAGNLEGAEEYFRRAHQLGWDPQPGYALLLVAQGRGEAALRALERTLDDPGWVRQRRGILLANLALVAAYVGDRERAATALAELDDSPDLAQPPLVAATTAQARGELRWCEGRLREAAAHLREAARLWHELQSPLNGAGCRLRLAGCLAADGDRDGAELERAAAEATFSRLGCRPGLPFSSRRQDPSGRESQSR
jgi:DNA-binding winged helix-turn-helix (wHTH) protein/Tfp pilus assembly protein PilF